MSVESKPSSFETVVAAFTVVATFSLGYCYWRLETRQAELDAKIEVQAEEFQRSLLEIRRDAEGVRAADSLELQLITLVSPHLAQLRESGREAATSQRIVAAAAELLSSRGRPGLQQMVERVREQQTPPAAAPEPRTAAEQPAPQKSAASAWLVLLATFPGTDPQDRGGSRERQASGGEGSRLDLGRQPLQDPPERPLRGRARQAPGSIGCPGPRVTGEAQQPVWRCVRRVG